MRLLPLAAAVLSQTSGLYLPRALSSAATYDWRVGRNWGAVESYMRRCQESTFSFLLDLTIDSV